MENTLRYLIVEDDDFDRLSVESEADKFPFLTKIAACRHPLEAAELIEQHRPDILFLDVEMPGMSGIDLLRLLRGQSFLVVYITSHPEFAVEGFELAAFDYLVKPLTAERFARCVLRLRDFAGMREKACAFEKEQEAGAITIKQGHDKVRLQLGDIQYLEAMKDYTRVVTTDRQYLVLTTLSDLLEKVPAEKFVRIHRSYAVARDKVTAVHGNKLKLAAAELPVGKLYRHAVKGMLAVILVLLQVCGMAQGYKEKMAALTARGDSLRLDAAASHSRLKQVGLDGLRLAKEGDFDHRSRFATFVALGYYYETHFDSAQYYFYQSLYAAQRGHLTRLIERACVTLIPVNFQLQQIEKTDSCKNILQSIVDTTRDRRMLEDGYYALGGYYQYKAYYSTAQDYFIRSIELREKEVDTTSDPRMKFDFAIQCDMLSKLYLNTQMTDKSLEALRKGQRFASISPNVRNRLVSSFVEAFSTSGHIDSALSYNHQLETDVANPLLFPSEVVSSGLNIAIYYLDQGEYDEALPYISKAETVATKVQSPLLNFQVQMTRARYLIGKRAYPQAISMLQLSLPVAKQLDKELYSNDLKYMAQAQDGKGDLAAALRYYKQYVEVQDTLNKEKLSRTFADLETHYQTHEKELRIEALDRENQVNVLQLKNASQTKLMLVLGLAALGVISLLLYFFYRNKVRLNRELAKANDTKARLFGIIGHDLRSPVGKIVRMLQLQKERPELFTPEARKAHEESLKKASEHVLETMEDLLIWSKSQMAHFHPEYRRVAIREILDKEITLMQDQLEEKQVTVVDDVAPGLTRESDENFLSVIIRNLLQNAVRHSDGDRRVFVAGTDSEVTITNPTTTANATVLNQRLSQGRVDSGTSGLGLQLASDLAGRIGAKLYFRGEAGVSLTAVLSWA
ncbi:MAG TPA: LytTR family transcriptional regulator DNA-binding domain-containing protein [Puia sp.]|nr:LytTR family transcriptional regulator DNA-binding domain-containing protein [Puia sp.]